MSAQPPPGSAEEPLASNPIVTRVSPSGDKSAVEWLRYPAVLLLLLCALTYLLYSGSLGFSFVWDDSPQIVNNPLIRSWHEVPRVFVSDLWYHSARSQVYYRPLFTTWSILNYSLFELKPWGWHLGGLLVHLFAVVAVFFTARKLGIEYWTSALAALLFALHPVHIECVSWVSAASDSMVTFFFLLAFFAFVTSREQTRENWMVWRSVSLLLLACALLTKEMGLTFCAVVAIYVWLFPSPEAGTTRQRVVQCLRVALPYAVITIGYLWLRKLAMHQVAGVFDPRHGLVDMVLTWPVVLASYLRILVFPVGLTGLYYTPYVETLNFSRFLLPMLVLAGLAAALWYWWSRTGDRLIPFAGSWMLVTLAPALYLRSFANGDFVRDRYIYLPSVGFVLLLAMAIRLLPRLKTLTPQVLQIAAVCILAGAYLIGSFTQQVYWGDNLLVFSRGHDLYPQSDYATVGYANELIRRGGYDRAIPMLEEVTRRQAAGDSSSAYLAYFALASAYIKSDDKVAGRAMLDKSVAMAPSYFSSEVSKMDLAGLYGQLGDYDRALSLCAAVQRSDPGLYSALYNCGNIHFFAGQYAEAEKLLSQAILAAPDQAAPYYFLGRVYLQTGRPMQAESAFRKAVALDPNVYDYHYWYAQTLQGRGDIPDARRELLAALSVKSDGAEAKAALAALPATP